MTPVAFPRVNCIFGPPRDWVRERDGDCQHLPVAVAGSLMTSAWRPTPEQLAVLNAGGLVTLTVCGSVHPPVMLDAMSERGLELQSAAAG
jgi:hypothetical protein